METVAIIAAILKELPTAITTVDAAWEWGKKYWAGLKAAYNIDEATLTPAELVAHIANFRRSSGVIQRID